MRRYVFHLAILTLAALSPGLARGSDQEIAQQIIEKLQAEKQAGTLKRFSIDLQVDEGTVWLSGRVASDDQQFRALDLARRVPGVKQVVNDLTIGSPLAKTPGSRPANSPAPSLAAAPASALPTPAPPAAPQATHATAAHSMPPAVEVVRIQPTPAEPTYVEPSAQMPAALAANSASEPADCPPPSTPAYNPMLNSISKALVSAVGGGRNLDEQPTKKEQSASKVQHASGSLEVARSGGPIGSGVDSSVLTPQRAVVQAAQPVAGVPQQFVATPAGMQPVAPQMAMMAMPMQMQMPYGVPVYAGSQMQVPLAMGPARTVQYVGGPVGMGGAPAPVPMAMPGSGVGIAPARYDHPQMPGYAWPSYAAHPNYAAVTYPKQYSPTAWPYIGPFYPYPQVPLGWRKVTLEWDDGWWMLDFKDRRSMYNH